MSRRPGPPLSKFAEGWGQASLEMTVALIGALILLFGSLKVFLWINQRIIQRQVSYEATRTGGQRTEPNQPLRIFNE